MTLLVNKNELDNAPDGPKVRLAKILCGAYLSLFAFTYTFNIGGSSIDGQFGSRFFT